MNNSKKDEVNKQDGCSICKEQIIDLEIETLETGWFAVDLKVKFCPYCGKKL